MGVQRVSDLEVKVTLPLTDDEVRQLKIGDHVSISGTIYTARQLYDLGVIDVITPDGTGHAAVHGFIDKHSRNIAGRQAFERARNAVSPTGEEELMRVVEIWADTALKLQERDLKVMDRLIRAQSRNNDQLNQPSTSNVVPFRALTENAMS